MESIEALFNFLLPLAAGPPAFRPIVYASSFLSGNVKRSIQALMNTNNVIANALHKRRKERASDQQVGKRQDMLGKLLDVVEERGAKIDYTDQNIQAEIANAL